MTEAAKGEKLFLAAIAAGILLLLASPGLPGTPHLAWAGLSPLLWASRRANPGKAFLLGLAGGLVYYSGLLYWIIIVLGHYGHLPLWVSIPIMLLLALYMSLYLALFAAGTSWTKTFVSPIWLAPLLWISLDYLRASLFSGFPWQDLAYSQFQVLPVIQTADLVGHYGVTFLLVLGNCLILSLIEDRWPPGIKQASGSFMRSRLPALLLLATALIYGQAKLTLVNNSLPKAEHILTTVVQGNIPQDEKWVPAFQRRTIDNYISQSTQALKEQPSQLVIWPETALPFYPREHPLTLTVLNQLVQKHEAHLLTGAPYRTKNGQPPEMRYFNSAMLFSPKAQPTNDKPLGGLLAGRYDKQHLVPFGEYIPLRQILPLPGPLVETISDFSPGNSSTLLDCQGTRLGVLICFESIFPSLAAAQVRQGADLLINITNDAWFGRSSAPWQHLSMAVFRAVETRRSLARAANTGISCFIDPTGRISQMSPLFTTYWATAKLPLGKIKTVYLDYGHLFPLICLLLTGIILLRRKKNTNSDY